MRCRALTVDERAELVAELLASRDGKLEGGGEASLFNGMFPKSNDPAPAAASFSKTMFTTTLGAVVTTN